VAKTPTEIKSLARLHTETALNTLKSIASSNSAADSARVAAAVALLDRGWGKATQYVEAKVGPLDGLSTDDKRNLLEAIETLTGCDEGASGGTAESYH